MLYLTLSDCGSPSPPILVFTEDNFAQSRVYAARYFLSKAIVIDDSNYEVPFPSFFRDDRDS